jgi:hypothetical protein
MDKAIAKKLKQFTLDEIEYRKKWREAVDILQKLTQPITDHNQKCCEFWHQHFPNDNEITVIMDNNTVIKINKPEREVAKVEAFLPYGIDFTECKLFDISSEQ